MKSTLLLLFIFYNAFACTSQQKQLDSVFNELKKHGKEDTIRLKLLLGITHYYANVNGHEGLKAGSEALGLAKKLQAKKLEGVAYTYIAQNYQTLGEDSIALVYCADAMAVKQQQRDSLGMAGVYHAIGMSYFGMSDYYNALKNEQRALQIFTDKNDSLRRAAVLNSLGVDFQYLGNYPEAMKNYQLAADTWNKTGNITNSAKALTNIGIIFNNLGNFSKALEYHKKSLALHEATGDSVAMSDNYGNIGNVYDEMHDTLQARKYFRIALDLSQKSGYEFGLASAMGNLGISYTGTKEFDSAIPYLQASIKKFTILHDNTSSAIMMDYLCTIYITGPDKVLRKYNIPPATKLYEAAKLQLRSISLATKSQNIRELGDAYENLSQIYKKQANYKKALNAYERSIVFKDSLLNDDKRQQITRLEMQYQFNKKEDSTILVVNNKQSIAKAEIQKQKLVKNATIAGAGFLTLAGFGAFIFYKRNRDNGIKRNEAELKQQISETEMKALRAQMNPHFIFNSLNSIGDYIKKNNIGAADDFLVGFAQLMRAILENSESKEVSLSADLKALELYMQLESQRLKNKFSYEIIIDDGIDKDNTLIPPLLLQPFVENSIWHGIAENQSQGKILIHIKNEGDMINCIVEDNGIGLQNIVEEKTGKKSMGMKITQARIDILNKTKKANASLQLFSLKQGTRAEVKLPLQLRF